MDISVHEFLPEVQKLLEALAEKSEETVLHCIRVSYLSLKIAEKMKISDPELKNLIRNAAAIHDIGKIKLDPMLLRKGELSKEEYEIIKTHTIFNVNEYFKISIPFICEEVIFQHHERENGSGYPRRLKSNQIAPAAKICAVADSFDAMTSMRYYQEAKTKNDAIKELKNMSPDFYDMNVIRAFINSLD